jgi:hypothetical protein
MSVRPRQGGGSDVLVQGGSRGVVVSSVLAGRSGAAGCSKIFLYHFYF